MRWSASAAWPADPRSSRKPPPPPHPCHLQLGQACPAEFARPPRPPRPPPGPPLPPSAAGHVDDPATLDILLAARSAWLSALREEYLNGPGDAPAPLAEEEGKGGEEGEEGEKVGIFFNPGTLEALRTPPPTSEQQPWASTSPRASAKPNQAQ
jgi:hypothetical protein